MIASTPVLISSPLTSLEKERSICFFSSSDNSFTSSDAAFARALASIDCLKIDFLPPDLHVTPLSHNNRACCPRLFRNTDCASGKPDSLRIVSFTSRTDDGVRSRISPTGDTSEMDGFFGNAFSLMTSTEGFS